MFPTFLISIQSLNGKECHTAWSSIGKMLSPHKRLSPCILQEFVMHGQCDAVPVFTFLAKEHGYCHFPISLTAVC